MKYMRKTAGYTQKDYKINTEMAKELNITPVFGQNAGLKKKLVAPYKQVLS
jgi:phage anti-repressor protein